MFINLIQEVCDYIIFRISYKNIAIVAEWAQLRSKTVGRLKILKQNIPHNSQRRILNKKKKSCFPYKYQPTHELNPCGHPCMLNLS